MIVRIRIRYYLVPFDLETKPYIRCEYGKNRVNFAVMLQFRPPARTTTALLLISICIAGYAAYSEIRVQQKVALIQKDGLSRAQAERMMEQTSAPDILLAAADALMPEDAVNAALSARLVEQALSGNAQQPFAWARLAYFDTLKDGRLTPSAIEAFRTSIEQCGYCDRELLRWRLLFVLQHWDEMPEDIRLTVFQGADFLRWWHLDHKFLRQTSQVAEAASIPFKTYQRQVGTPVRPHELPR